MLTVDPRDSNDLLTSFGDHLLDALASVSALCYLSANLSQRGEALPMQTRARLQAFAVVLDDAERLGQVLCDDDALNDAIDAADAAEENAAEATEPTT